MSNSNRSLALMLGAAVCVAAVGLAAFLYARSRAQDGPVRSAEVALSEAREKIQQIERQLARQRDAA